MTRAQNKLPFFTNFFFYLRLKNKIGTKYGSDGVIQVIFA
jgi:hypothetical protein